jgi:RNA polymerase sigma-70 factor (ECF subfamily)
MQPAVPLQGNGNCAGCFLVWVRGAFLQLQKIFCRNGFFMRHYTASHCHQQNPMSGLTTPLPSFEQQVADLHGYLLKFARLQLRNDTWAEDAVSETLLAALSKPQAFGNRSQLKTWLVGILKHKVIDAMRQRGREVCQVSDSEDSNEDPLDYLGFKADGHFTESPADWGNPEQQASSKQFFEVLEACTQHLPVVQGRLFLMREWLELSSEEICKELGLTPTNLYVQLHRARLRLRECLELNWYGKAVKP